MTRYLVAALALTSLLAAQEWHAVPGHLQTKWAADVSPDRAWPEYPRPTLRRAAWQNLNGLWDYAVTAAGAPMPEAAQGRILVPFPLESSLSGVARSLSPEQRLWYRRTFVLPGDAAWRNKHVLLHFGAVDWACEVTVDRHPVGEHRGGYDPFSFDITTALTADGPHTLVVAVRDPSDGGPQPRGKQVRHPSGIWYTPCSGIWQTVWLEPVPATHLLRLQHRAEVARRAVTLTADVAAAEPGDRWQVTLSPVGSEPGAGGDKAVIGTAAQGRPLRLVAPADGFEPWRPDTPALYPVRVELLRGGKVIDTTDSYVAFRELTLGAGRGGITRLLLNGEPLFQFGPLDQGFWPDGIYAPPSFAAMCADLDAITSRGCNMLRKHVKVENELFYAECDRRGILVWQDMPSGSTQDDPAEFEHELRALIGTHCQHPSIVMWVVFNEGWGQHDTEHYVELVRQLDPTRWISNASGWTDRRCGDVIDLHRYPGPGMLPPEPARASVLGEYGGLGLPLRGHTWVDKDNWGYVSFRDRDELTRAYLSRLEQLRPLIAQGLSAAVYTQTTDVEIECNGWLTYDRAIDKIPAAAVRDATRRLYERPGEVTFAVPCAAQTAQRWRWTTTAPPAGWSTPGFDNHAWASGQSGFGTKSTPGAHVGTVWNTSDLWLRREIVLPEAPLHEPVWYLHHDEDVEVFVDGQPALALGGYTTGYVFAPTDATTRDRLTPGHHVLAVHCRQTRGGQFIDVGIADLVPAR